MAETGTMGAPFYGAVKDAGCIRSVMICSTPAFVLRQYDFRETSKIAIFFTRDFGKVKGVLKGIRRDPRKFASTLSILSLNHIVFYRKRVSEIHLVGQCDLIDDFGLHGADLGCFGVSHWVAECVDLVAPLEQAHRDIFTLIHEFYAGVAHHGEANRHVFLLKLLSLSGFKPNFESCVFCQSSIPMEAFFSHARGGLLCPRCRRVDGRSERIAKGIVASIRYIQRSEWAACSRLAMSGDMRRQLDEILECFIRFHLGRGIRSRRYLEELRQTDAMCVRM